MFGQSEQCLEDFGIYLDPPKYCQDSNTAERTLQDTAILDTPYEDKVELGTDRALSDLDDERSSDGDENHFILLSKRMQSI